MVGRDFGGRDQQPAIDLAPGHDVAFGVGGTVFDAGQALVDRLALQVDEAHAIDVRDGLVIVHRPDLPARDQRADERAAPFRRLPHGNGETGERDELALEEELGHFEVQPLAHRPLARHAEQFRFVPIEMARDGMGHASSESPGM
jgi:hypothetical protein